MGEDTRKWISFTLQRRSVLTILTAVVPRTMLSSTRTIRLLYTALREGFSLIFTPKSRMPWSGSMKVRPT